MKDLISVLQGHPETLQAIGVFGFSLYITAFTLLQTGRICGNSAAYTCFVVVAASCVLISLVSAFNLAAFLIQSSYVCIGLFGLGRRLLIHRMKQDRYRSPPLRQSFAAAMRKSH
ncbi:hypothetical protein PXK00_07935 [Phaeobacter sp. QD34_3]|uniref:CBU_0592 family membrane protein n=1 Tax=unclassified Phaeobacter TaxID=2621772 RepID=UPI00237EFFC1|nr:MULTISPECIES: hypothetical protein [unclassified Phaeobacter]MDE4133037.1 hypothetical protein [Phaeobacter sp. QD34_3]MDE4136561.1 hypothetical protein [Phaeobacter sp. QD34_24]MDE4174251.1 hypothetical protein [Phaeobacter sp. PT47_59]